MNEHHPPGEVTRVAADRVLVVAPHYDDEVIGCGGLLLQLVSSGADVRVLFLSDGAGRLGGDTAIKAYVARRRAEAARVAERIGIASSAEMGLPDGRLLHHVETIARDVGGAIVEFEPQLVLVPSPSEVSADHRAAFMALHRLLSSLHTGHPARGPASAARFFLYEVNGPQRPTLLVDVSDHLDDVIALITLYFSQMEQHDYASAAAGLRRFRTLTLPPEVRAAEAYRELGFDDFATRSHEDLVRHLGGIHDHQTILTGPLVSAIVRTRDRPDTLAETLASIADSTYRDVEVVLVNDGGQAPEIPDAFPFPIRPYALPATRGPAAAAQAGLEAAQGEYVCFLDDDDIWYPEHLATLVTGALGSGSSVVYGGSVHAICERSADDTVHCVDRFPIDRHRFDPQALARNNTIPFHTLLIERALAIETGPFDASLPLFEDWDFLIRLSERTRFVPVAGVTCEYRHFTDDRPRVLGRDPDARPEVIAARAQIHAKHADRLDPEARERPSGHRGR